MGCPWCHLVASEAVRQSAEHRPVDAELQYDQFGCGKSAPVSLWQMEGQASQLAGASDDALAELSKLTPGHQRRVEARLRAANEELSALLAITDDGRAMAFLETWTAMHIRPLAGDRGAEVSGLLAQLVTAWHHSGIPEPALWRAAGGNLGSFIEQALDGAR
jgi:hypothetical protein